MSTSSWYTATCRRGDRVQTPCFPGFSPRTPHGRTRPAPPSFHQSQRSTHRRHMNPNAGLPNHRLDEQFTRPRRPAPAIVLGRGTHHLVENRQKALIELSGTVVLARVPQGPFAMFAKTLGDAVHGGVMHAKDLRRAVRGSAVEQVDQDQVADADSSIATAAQVLAELLLDREANRPENRLHGNSLLGARSPECLHVREFPFLRANLLLTRHSPCS